MKKWYEIRVYSSYRTTVEHLNDLAKFNISPEHIKIVSEAYGGRNTTDSITYIYYYHNHDIYL